MMKAGGGRRRDNKMKKVKIYTLLDPPPSTSHSLFQKELQSIKMDQEYSNKIQNAFYLQVEIQGR